MQITPEMTLDAKGLNCPLPVLKARKSIKQVSAGGVLQILSTDPGSVDDLANFCHAGGHELLSSSESSGTFMFLIKKAA